MNSVNTSLLHSGVGTTENSRRVAFGDHAGALTDIYLDEVNLAVWQRQLPTSIQAATEALLAKKPGFQASMTVTADTAFESIAQSLGDAVYNGLAADMAEVADMFCCLFELKRTGLRITALDRAMCPKFHVDKVPCRLITTYQGEATQWLRHDTVNRDKLGARSADDSPGPDGLYTNPSEVQQLNCGDIALLKGELWEGNENAGLVHRSPALTSGQKRLLLTLDFSG